MLKASKGRHLVAALVASGAVGACAPAAASASSGLLGTTLQTVSKVLSGTNCAQTYAETTPFSPWSDTNSYRLVPGGNFPTTGSGWSLAGGASIAPSSDPNQLAGAAGAGEVVLPSGSSAVSPYSCVDTGQPTIRFMDAGNPQARLIVDVTFVEPAGLQITLPVGVVAPGAKWQPSPTLVDLQVVGGLLQGGAVPMALSFQASGGTVDVSDAFVDPRMRS
ncbi:MAG TPA: hypothetical protein VGL69_13825 [Solirubrobacteraceae bacterium]|jgi:hypothetical protein